MKNIKLYIPKIEELWFREKCMSDKGTMEYNAGYDVHYAGYHYDTGCIDFPKDKWESWYNEKMLNPNFYYAYIFDVDLNQFVGYVNFNINSESKKATMGIVINKDFQGMGYMRPAMQELIKAAKAKNVKYLTDTVPEVRERALRVFYDLGFNKVSAGVSKKFGEDEIYFLIEKKL